MSVVVALAAVLACVPACGKKDSGKIKIGIVTNCTAEFWSICEAGANKAADTRTTTSNFSSASRRRTSTPACRCRSSRRGCKQGVNGHRGQRDRPAGPDRRPQAHRQEAPLITMDNDADQTGRLCYIGIDNYEAGKAVGRLVKKSLPRRRHGRDVHRQHEVGQRQGPHAGRARRTGRREGREGHRRRRTRNKPGPQGQDVRQVLPRGRRARRKTAARPTPSRPPRLCSVA